MCACDQYIESPKYPAGLGYESAGIVDAVGKDVTGVAVGDVVSTMPALSLNRIFHVWRGHSRPGLRRREASEIAFVCRGRVDLDDVRDCLRRVIEDAKVTKGDFVVIPAASSSVGLAAIQLANYAGATPIALTRTSQKRKRLLEAVPSTSSRPKSRIWSPK